MKKSILVLAVFIFGLKITQAQVSENLNSKPFIEVTGTSETEITPDEIYITITLQERAENREKLNIEKQEDDLKQNIKELGIDISNLTLNTANSDFRKIKSLKKDVIISKSYTLKITNSDLIGKVYERLDKINAFDAYISKLNHTKILEYTKENRIKAIKAAKDKVDYLLLAAGKQAGNPLQITEVDNSVNNTPYNYYGGYYNRRSAASNVVQSYSNIDNSDSDKDEISIKKIKIKSSFLVKYEIK
ncbi:MAG: SIMPL domain-containing protein [Bacteroidota bacterium]|nr:SIMPL domain-containing protein [Bacteroidota bacterium]